MTYFPEAPPGLPISQAPDYDAFVQRYRDSVPATRRFSYLNHASVGPLSDWVVAAVDEHLRQQQMADTASPDAWFDGWRLARQRVSELHGDGDRANVALFSSTYNGMQRAFNALPLSRGDEALCPADEFPSLYHALTEVRRSGAEITIVDSAAGDKIVRTEDVLNAITPRTKLIAVSWVNFFHGYRHDLALLGRECRAREIWLVVDSIQGLGMLQLDAPAIGAHFISGQGAKWLSAPLGSGFMWVSPDVPPEVTPATEGWFAMELNHDSYTDRTVAPKRNANRFAEGTVPLASAFGLRRACEIILEADRERCEQRALQHADAIDEAATESGISVFSDRRHSSGSFGPQRSAIISLRVGNVPGLADSLRSANVTFSVREGCLRLSPHWYNTAEELQRVCELIRAARPAIAAAP